MTWLQRKRLLAVVSVAATVLLPSGPAEARRKRGGAAAGNQPGCADRLGNAELQVMTNHLVDAARMLAACSRKSCGAALSRKCRLRRAKVERSLAQLTVTATDESGAPVEGQSSLDGALATRKVDPGSHELVFKATDGRTATQKLVLSRGEHRTVSIVLPPGTKGARPDVLAGLDLAAKAPAADAAAPAPAVSEAAIATAERSVSEDPPSRVQPKRGGPGPYLLGVVGLAGVGGYALLTYWGRADNDNLANCTPRCPLETVHHIRQLYLAADISAAVGGAALLGSTIWLIARSGSSRPEVAAARPRLQLDVHPTRAGALATVSGGF